MKKLLSSIGLAATLAFAPNNASSAMFCDNANILSGSLITDVCWECLMPIRIAGVEFGSGDVPEAASDKSICTCPDQLGIPQPGFVTSMYEPARLIELVEPSGCSPTLGGITLPLSNIRYQGDSGGDEDIDADLGAYYHYHYFAFPLLVMLQMFVIPTCNADGYADMDLMYLSEVDPTWNNELLALFTTPEAAAFANPIALSVCAQDAVAATAGRPQDNLFWCLGNEGAYPFTGHFNPSGSFAQNASTLSAKVLASLHRKGFARKTMGNDNLCKKNFAPMLPKSQYKMGMMYPVADGDSSHYIGENDAVYGAGKWVPGKNNAVMMLYRYNDCCVH